MKSNQESILTIEDKLIKIETQIDALKLNYNYKNGFNSKNDLDQFISDNKIILEEANNLRKQIKTMKWKLMTSDEQAKKIETVRKILTKSGGKSQTEILEFIQSKIKNEGGL